MQQYIETIGQLRYPNHGLNVILNQISIIAIYSLFVLVPFNFIMIDVFPFYREAYAFLFTLIIINYYYVNRVNILKLPNNYIVIILVYWIIFIGFCYIFDPQVSLYPDEDITLVTEQLTRFSRSDYMIRNLFLYLPLAVVISIRRLTMREFNILLLLICVVCPFSTILYYQYQGFQSIADIMIRFRITGHGLTSYNDYIPYLTFPFISGIYLFYRYKNVIVRSLMLLLIISIFITVIFSTSRQSFLFCLIAMFSYAYLRGRKIIPVVIIISIAGYYLISSFAALQSRFLTGRFAESPRVEVIMHGLAMVGGIKEWLIGNGLSCVLSSGPHNNFVRFIQRIGLVGMFLTYFPFYYMFIKLVKEIWHFKNRSWFDRDLAWFLLMAVTFTLYHSSFGYPHEEVWSAPFVWLTLGLGLDLGRKGRVLQTNSSGWTPGDSVPPGQPLRVPKATPTV